MENITSLLFYFSFSFKNKVAIITISKDDHFRTGVTATEMPQPFWFMYHKSEKYIVVLLKWHYWGKAME